MKRWMWVGGAFLALAVIVGAGAIGYRENAKHSAPAVTIPQTIMVERGPVVYTVTGPGVAIDNGETPLIAQVSGQVEQVNVQPGNRITAGQVLAVIGKRADFQSAVDAAQAQVQQAQQTLDALSPEMLISQAELAQIQAQQDYQRANNMRLNPDSPRGSQAARESATAEFHLARQAFEDAQNAYDDVSNLPADDVSRNTALGILGAARNRLTLATWNLDYLDSKPSAEEVAASLAKAALAKATLDQADQDLALAQNGQSAELIAAQAALASARAV